MNTCYIGNNTFKFKLKRDFFLSYFVDDNMYVCNTKKNLNLSILTSIHVTPTNFSQNVKPSILHDCR